MMDPKIKQLWLDELRSGKYIQGEGNLRVNNRFCCLGVLCEIYSNQNRRTMFAESWEAPRLSSTRDAYRFAGSDTVLPPIVREWAQLNEVDPVVNEERPGVGTIQMALSGLNDGGYTFAELANIIEEQL